MGRDNFFHYFPKVPRPFSPWYLSLVHCPGLKADQPLAVSKQSDLGGKIILGYMEVLCKFPQLLPFQFT